MLFWLLISICRFMTGTNIDNKGYLLRILKYCAHCDYIAITTYDVTNEASCCTE